MEQENTVEYETYLMDSLEPDNDYQEQQAYIRAIEAELEKEL